MSFYRVALRKKIYRTIQEMQTDLDIWLAQYNQERTHQSLWCYGKTRCRPSSTPYPR